jgi:hypothetical protein
MPMPQAAYISRSESTSTVTGLLLSPSLSLGPPTALSQVSVEEGLLWDTATKWIEGFAEAALRREMKDASATDSGGRIV